MTDTNTLAPADAEIIALADETRTGESGRDGYILPISFARAVLAKWGQPTPPAVVEPLTDEQIVGVMHSIPINAAPSHHIAFARAIEAAHGIGIKKGGRHA